MRTYHVLSALLLGQILLDVDSASLRLRDNAANEAAAKKLGLYFFGPVEGRPRRIGGVWRDGQFGPHCGHRGESKNCICCGTLDDTYCDEPHKALDNCDQNDFDGYFGKKKSAPKKVKSYDLPSDFPDVRK